MTFLSYAICMYFYLHLRHVSGKKDHAEMWSGFYTLTLFITLLVKPYTGVFLIYGGRMLRNYPDVSTFIDATTGQALFIAVLLGFYFFATARVFRRIGISGHASDWSLILTLLIGGFGAYTVALILVYALGLVFPV